MAARHHFSAARGVSGPLLMARHEASAPNSHRFKTTWAWQADIGGLRKQLTEEWETKLEEQKRKHNLEVKQLEEEVEREQEYRKQLEEKARLEYDEMREKRDAMGEEEERQREEKWKKEFEILEHETKERKLQS